MCSYAEIMNLALADIQTRRAWIERQARRLRDAHLYRAVADPETSPILDVESLVASIATAHLPLPWDDRRFSMTPGRDLAPGFQADPGEGSDMARKEGRVMTLADLPGFPTSSMRRMSSFVCVALLIVTAPIVAQNDTGPSGISTDRPGQTTPPSVVRPGSVQIEAGFQMVGDRSGAGPTSIESRTLSLPGALVRIGALASTEVRLGAEFRSVTTTIGDSDRAMRGVASVSVGAKVALAPEEGAIPEAAILTVFTLPVGSEPFQPESVAPICLLATRTSLSTSANLYCNIGGSWDGVNGAGTGVYAALLGATLSGDLSGFVELYGSFPAGLPPVHAADAGLALVLAPSLQLDIFGGVGMTDAAPDYFLNTGISVRLAD